MPRGPWRPPRSVIASAEGPLLVHVASGLMMRGLTLQESSGSVLGAGEIGTIRDGIDSYLPQTVEWTALTRVRLTVIDVTCAQSTPGWARVSVDLVERLEEQLRRQAELTAIGHLRLVDDRVLAMLLHLAERYGRVGPDGVTVPLELTHDIIGQLTGSSRPTVSIAMRRLREAGLVARSDEGGWKLSPEAAAQLTSVPRQDPEPPGLVGS